MPAPRVCLSTSSVYPEPTGRAFELARSLGYDGVEVMVGLDPASADLASLERLRDYHQIPITAIHAPCLLVTRRVWGTDPWEKLERSAAAAKQLGADVVVVHPPFRWQRSYATDFTQGVRALHESSGVVLAVENMYPWRGPLGADLQAYAPSWDAGLLDCDHLTLDFSHAATARQQAGDLVASWGERLRHVHLTDGTPGTADEHRIPGEGNQRVDEVLRLLAAEHWDGQVVAEVKTNDVDGDEREAILARTLSFARHHLSVEVGR